MFGWRGKILLPSGVRFRRGLVLHPSLLEASGKVCLSPSGERRGRLDLACSSFCLLYSYNSAR